MLLSSMSTCDLLASIRLWIEKSSSTPPQIRRIESADNKTKLVVEVSLRWPWMARNDFWREATASWPW